jgi:hypothetical protein
MLYVRVHFESLTEVSININIFCNLRPYSLVRFTYVSEEYATFIFRVVSLLNISLR